MVFIMVFNDVLCVVSDPTEGFAILVIGGDFANPPPQFIYVASPIPVRPLKTALQ